MAYVVGVDVGSAFSKAVVVSRGELIAYDIVPSGGDYKLTADRIIKAAVAKVDLPLKDVACVVATGYGAATVTLANEIFTEIRCEARGVSRLFASVRTVMDIGGQFTRVFKVDDRGKAIAFVLSEKCAAGSGRFLEVIARVLQVDLAEIGELSLKSQEKVDFNTGCAVFAQSEAICRIAEGTPKEDILAGIHRAMAAKTLNLVERAGLEPDCALIGGGAKDVGLVKSIEEILGLRLSIPEEPQIVAALGAALLAGEKSI